MNSGETRLPGVEELISYLELTGREELAREYTETWLPRALQERKLRVEPLK